MAGDILQSSFWPNLLFFGGALVAWQQYCVGNEAKGYSPLRELTPSNMASTNMRNLNDYVTLCLLWSTLKWRWGNPRWDGSRIQLLEKQLQFAYVFGTVNKNNINSNRMHDHKSLLSLPFRTVRGRERCIKVKWSGVLWRTFWDLSRKNVQISRKVNLNWYVRIQTDVNCT